MTSQAAFRCTKCEHEWQGKPNADREAPPRCSECGASGGSIEIVAEPDEGVDEMQLSEAEVVSRLRAGETVLDIVESGAMTIEEAKQIQESVQDLGEVVKLETEELEEVKQNAYARGRNSRDDEVQSLEQQNRGLKQQLRKANTTIGNQKQVIQFQEQQIQWKSDEIEELSQELAEARELEDELELEREKRKAWEAKAERRQELIDTKLAELTEEVDEQTRELEECRRACRQKDERIDELKALRVDDVAGVAQVVNALFPPGVGHASAVSRLGYSPHTPAKDHP